VTERMPRRRAALGAATSAALVALVAAVLVGCTAPDDGGGPTTAFVTPSPPGGSASDGAETDADTAPPEAETTAADVAFMEAMVAHHEQAVELAGLAPGRAADAELADLASRMRAVQAAEAESMRSWLERRRTRDLLGDDHDDAQAMRGEISRSTLDRAAELDGAAFDELFIDAMVAHHLGAVEMAEARLAEAGDAAVARWARAIATSQSLEVDRLREIEARLAAE
jgi:uncharacterized protein (DUF305 family)